MNVSSHLIFICLKEQFCGNVLNLTHSLRVLKPKTEKAVEDEQPDRKLSGVTSNFGPPCKKIIWAPSTLTT